MWASRDTGIASRCDPIPPMHKLAFRNQCIAQSRVIRDVQVVADKAIGVINGQGMKSSTIIDPWKAGRIVRESVGRNSRFRLRG
jgi:hypothetical protein